MNLCGVCGDKSISLFEILISVKMIESVSGKRAFFSIVYQATKFCLER